MNTFMAILSQLFWGVTIGALTATFTWIGKAMAAALCIPAGFWLWKRRKHLRKLP